MSTSCTIDATWSPDNFSSVLALCDMAADSANRVIIIALRSILLLLDESLAMDLIKETITATVLVRPWAGRFAVDGLDRGDLLQCEDGIDEGLRVKGGTPLLIEWTLVNQSGL